MMGKQSGQLDMIWDMSELIPKKYLLRKINEAVDGDFIYDLLPPYYLSNEYPSVDPFSMFKIPLIGYLYGIKSKCRFVKEVEITLAYRWFCGFELRDKIPDYSTFSKT